MDLLEILKPGEVKNAKRRYWFDPEIKSLKEKHTIEKCRGYLDDLISSHVSITSDTVYLYRDDFMTDELISKLQDGLAHTGLKIEIVYQPIEKK